MLTCSAEDSEYFVQKLDDELGQFGFEFHIFKIGWYNSHVEPVFQFPCGNDVIAVLVISTPSMFENGFLPYLKNCGKAQTIDPLDQCMLYYLSKIKDVFPDFGVEIIHDFELLPNRRPKVLVQTAAHVSGAAYLYQPNHIYRDGLSKTFKNQKKFGVCIHPLYGGWFALRGVAIFHNVQCPTLKMKVPQDVVTSQDEKARLLDLFNTNWKDWGFRDIIPVQQKYSKSHMRYFSTPPSERPEFLKELLS